MQRLSLLLTASALSAITVPATAADDLAQKFLSPPRTARPMIRWWWPGGAVQPDEIRRELALLDDAGIGGVEIQAFNPGIPAVTASERERIDSYAEATFFADVTLAAAEAHKRGMAVDYTFGSAWPSGGGAAITPEKALVELTMAVTAVAGGQDGPVRVEIPSRTRRLGALSSFDSRIKDPLFSDWSKRFDGRGRIVAAMAFRGNSPELKPETPTSGPVMSAWRDVLASGAIDLASRVDLTSQIKPDGTLSWAPPAGHWQVFVFKQYASNMGVMGSAGRGPQLVLDHFDRAAFDAHAARVGAPLVTALGDKRSNVRATFVDSLELMQDLPWREDFLAEFQRRRGYDLAPYLPLIVQPGWMQAWNEHFSPAYFEANDGRDTGSRVRADYRLTVSELLIENFVQPWVEWSHAHGFKAKFQAHGGALDTLLGYGLADIPETEDLVHGGDPLVMRLARSAANIYGRPLISAESMAWGLRPYSVTPDEIRRRVDLLVTGGVNAQTLHGYTYRFRDGPWPGWYAFQPNPFTPGFGTMLDERNPIWAGAPQLFNYMARLNAVMREGESVVPVAMFLGDIGYYVGIEDDSRGAQAPEKRLIAGGFDFDRINAHGLKGSRSSGKELLTPGGHRYAALVLPAMPALRPEIANRVADLAEAGLPVLFTGAIPSRSEGLKDAPANDVIVRRAMKRATQAGARVATADDLAATLVALAVRPNLRFLGDATDLMFVERRIGSRRVYFIRNGGNTDRRADFVASLKGGAERWDAMGGSVRAIDAADRPEGTEVRLQLAPGEAALIVIDPSKQPIAVAGPRELAVSELPSSGWSLTGRGHVTGGKPLELARKDISLGDWVADPDLARFAGEAIYSRAFTMPARWLASGKRVRLDLGTVHDMATVSVNGQTLPPLVSAPWSVDITAYLRSGKNRLAVAIANVPQNAMIDSANPTLRKLKPVPAGLVGPVRLRLATEELRTGSPARR